MDIFNHVLLISSIISLIIGSVIGLSQSRIKRLLAYSTVINVGFIFLGLLINTEQSIESFLFYLIQYTISNACIFIAILGLTYQIRNGTKAKGDLDFISELNGQFQSNPFVAFSLSICLFSIAGVPPLIGFFAKQIVLYSSIQIGYYFISIVAIICSTISASYYLQLVKSLYFESPKPLILDNPNIKQINNISNVHSLVISILTVIITFYVIDQEILLNSCRLLATQMFYYL